MCIGWLIWFSCSLTKVSVWFVLLYKEVVLETTYVVDPVLSSTTVY
jgi:hypothetical protein